MRFGGFRHSVFALLYLLVVVVFGTASADAVAKSSGNQGQFTKVGSIEPSISPSAPPPANKRFTLTAEVHSAASHGQKCALSAGVTATIERVTREVTPRKCTELHNAQADSTSFHFDFSGFPEATDLTPTL